MGVFQWRGGVGVALGLGALLTGGLFGSGVAGAEGAGFADRTGWDVMMGARNYEVYAKIPRDLRPSPGPATQVWLYGGPASCESLGAGYYLTREVEEAILSENQQVEGSPPPMYKNQTKVYSANPPGPNAAASGAVEPAGEKGPRWSSECATPLSGHGLARNVHVAGATSAANETTSVFDDDKGVITSEGTTVLNNLDVGELHVGQLETGLKVELSPTPFGQSIEENPPKISYTFKLLDVSNGRTAVVGSGEKGLVLSGQGVGASAVHSEFNKQANAHHEHLKELAVYGLTVLEPTITFDGLYWLVDSPVLLVGGGPGFRTPAGPGIPNGVGPNGPGQEQGFRLGQCAYKGTFSVRD